MLKRRSSSESRWEIDQSADRPDVSTKVLNGDSKGASAPRLIRDKERLPMTYDTALPGQAAKNKNETTTISVLWHELISPLTVIKGYASTLLQLDSAITEEQKEQYLKGIDAASNRVIRLLENLRDITMLEESNAVNPQRIPLLDLLQQSVAEVQQQTKRHVIHILPCPRLPLITADPEKLELVINNLLINAVKYSPNGGDIEIAVRIVRNESELRSMFGDVPLVKLPCLIVSVADNGVGIPGGELEKIFEKFYRVKNKLTRITPGAGLGLYICKIIIEAHEGRIWARNKLQGGSIFYFSLPLEKLP